MLSLHGANSSPEQQELGAAAAPDQVTSVMMRLAHCPACPQLQQKLGHRDPLVTWTKRAPLFWSCSPSSMSALRCPRGPWCRGCWGLLSLALPSWKRGQSSASSGRCLKQGLPQWGEAAQGLQGVSKYRRVSIWGAPCGLVWEPLGPPSAAILGFFLRSPPGIPHRH